MSVTTTGVIGVRCVREHMDATILRCLLKHETGRVIDRTKIGSGLGEEETVQGCNKKLLKGNHKPMIINRQM